MVSNATHTVSRPSLTRQLLCACQLAGGIVLTLAGAIVAVTPIPLGLPVMAAGLVVLTSCSPFCRQCAANVRRKLTWLNAALVKLEQHAPLAFARLLRQSNPHYRPVPGATLTLQTAK